MATIYKVVTTVGLKLLDGHRAVMWASSGVHAAKLRRELAERHGLRPLKDVVISSVDVPTSKAGLIEWLNSCHSQE